MKCMDWCRGINITRSNVGENSIAAAGALVYKDVPANILVGRVPAKVIRAID